MDPGADAPEEAQPSGSGEPAPAAEKQPAPPAPSQPQHQPSSSSLPQQQQQPSRYESQKRRDWNTFLQYLKNHKPPLTLARCCGANVIEFLKYLDQFGKTKVHNQGCNYFGHPNPPAPCVCPLKQAWGSLDALIGRLRAAYEESGGKPESNPFGAKAVRIYLREVRQSQAKARGIPYEKKKKKRKISQPTTSTATTASAAESSSAATEAEPEPEPEPEPAGGSTSVAAAGGGNGDQVPTPTPTPPPPLLPPPTASSS